MLKKSSSQEPLGQFEPNLAGYMLGGWRYRFVHIKGLALFRTQSGANLGTFSKIFKNLLLINHLPEYINM